MEKLLEQHQYETQLLADAMEKERQRQLEKIEKMIQDKKQKLNQEMQGKVLKGGLLNLMSKKVLTSAEPKETKISTKVELDPKTEEAIKGWRERIKNKATQKQGQLSFKEIEAKLRGVEYGGVSDLSHMVQQVNRLDLMVESVESEQFRNLQNQFQKVQELLAKFTNP